MAPLKGAFFNEKMKVYTYNPYDYNVISLKKMNQKKAKPLPGPIESAMDGTANLVGKWLGVLDPHDRELNYDKIWMITEWGRERTNSDDPIKIIDFLKDQANKNPQMADRRINDLYILSKLDKHKKPKEKEEVKKDPNKFIFEFTIKGGELHGSKE